MNLYFINKRLKLDIKTTFIKAQNLRMGIINDKKTIMFYTEILKITQMDDKLPKIAITLFLLVLILLLFIFDPDVFAEDNSTHSMGLMIPADVTEYWQTNIPDSNSYNSNSFPTSLDWSVNDSYVKYQSSCGSCWAFAAVALVENLGNKDDLSEQVIISCATGNCSGGWYGNALKYIHDNGIPDESCYQYISSNGSCADKCSHPAYLESITDYDYYGRWGVPTSGTINDLKNLLQSAPVLVSMRVPADGTFEGYSGGIYNYEGEGISSDRGHAVLVIGYNDTEGYFKAKNSWSSGWGESGYFRISYDEVTDDVQFGGYACTGSGVYTSQSTPVELASFTVRTFNNSVKLNWTTRTETNNYGFDVEKSVDGINFITIKFAKGFGTTSIPQSYTYTDTDLPVGKYFYRLKQIDFDGQITNSEIIEIVLTAPKNYSLTQNYPNPFNCETLIFFQLPDYKQVTFKIYNALGQEIKTLIEKEMSAGYHSITWDGKDTNGWTVPSGFYYYQIQSGKFVNTRRLILLR